MLRKITAAMFMLVIALLITLKHPVLGYCICLDTYFSVDCVCQVEKAPAPNTNCCASIAEESPSRPAPCGDCTDPLKLDVGDFVWQSSDKIPDNNVTYPPLSTAFSPETTQRFVSSIHTPISNRGDPPPGLTSSTLPLYLRNSELRL